MKRLDREIGEAVNAERPAEEKLRELVVRVPARAAEPPQLATARAELAKAMGLVARVLHSMWNEDRYVREAADDQGDAGDEDDGEEGGE